ncbi:hypothetical protein [uncultured Xanthomonas sp.]|uniref:DUF6630 family protein n=1 Tax=uncultured Xanthomonas sp. TaxID=152831 RepID=UPI0025F968E7|nr:hypothetical protein [uncultured Xanthomonas sp.]
MPDNSTDYDDPDDLHDELDDDPDTQQGLIWNLLLLINPGDEESALRQFNAFREARAEHEGEEDDGWLWTLKDAIDWSAGFYVDWKDTESLIGAIDELAARWNLRIDWGGDVDDEDFLDSHDVPALLNVAYDRLREHGYTLWCWDTEGDAYAGWMALSRDDEDMRRLAALLDIELRPGSDPF